MKLYIYGVGLAFALMAGVNPAGAQDKQAPYKFTKGELAKYEVVGSLEISLKGSHAEFIPGGVEIPLKMYYKGTFENVVLEVAESDGSAQIERRVRSMTANGEYQGQAWKYEYDREKDKNKAAPEAGSMAGLFHEWCTAPLGFTIDGEGKYSNPTNPNYDRLVMRAGAMYWPVKADQKTWVTEEKIAVPVLHDKIAIEFKNDFTKSITRENRKLMVINTTPKVKGAEKVEEHRGNVTGDIVFTVEGNGCMVEIDTTNRRLHSVKLDLAIKLTGKSPVSAGGEGDIKGQATFKESQVYKD